MDVHNDRSSNGDVYVVVPVFNESTVLADVLRELRETFPNVVVVDDGSSDDSAVIARAAGCDVVVHPFNMGQGAALQTGFEFALQSSAAQYICTFDSDGQHSVDDLQAGVSLMRQGGVDVLLGSRFINSGAHVPLFKRIVLKVGILITRLSSGLHLTDTHNGLRVLNRSAALKLNIQLNGMAHASEFYRMIRKDAMSFAEFPTHIEYTEYSRSKGQPIMNSVNIVFDMLVR